MKWCEMNLVWARTKQGVRRTFDGLYLELPWLLALFAVGACTLLLVAEAAARPGGGQSYGGGSSSRRSSGGGGGSGGGGDIGIVIDLIVLCIRYPALGGVVVVGVAGYYFVRRARGAHLPDWSVGVPQAQVAPAEQHFVARAALDRLRHRDPQFSVVVFEDFLFNLYTQLHVLRPGNGLEKLSAYVAAPVRQALHDPTLQEVLGVLVGSVRFLAFHTSPEHVRLELEVEANLTEVRGQKPERLYIVERLILQRAINARSRAPERARTLDCPSCGAPIEATLSGTCQYCRQQVNDGRFDWSVQAIHCVRTNRQPPLLTSNVAEQGNERPTVVAPGAHQRLQEIATRDPQFNFETLSTRVHTVFSELQVGWANQDLSRIRPYVSDNLLQYFSYWFDLYGQTRCKNITENARILRLELANVLSDNIFDALTVRVFATGLDYTLAQDGKVISGSRSKERPYTEYWTLIRGRQVTGVRDQRTCPNCGAELRINMAGHCEYCRVKVVSGQFDWVLSRIEQDDSYSG